MIKNIIIIVFSVDKIMQLGLLKYNANLLKQVYSRADFFFSSMNVLTTGNAKLNMKKINNFRP